MAEFAVRGDGPVTLCRRWGLDRDPKACYVLLDDGKPIYVGISGRVIERLREHVLRAHHLSATLAYRIARAEYPHRRTGNQAMEDQVFLDRFAERREYLKTLNVAFVKIDNDVELYLFEVYCAMELSTGLDNGGWNSFTVH